MNFRLFRTLFKDSFAVFLHILDSESKYGVKLKSVIEFMSVRYLFFVICKGAMRAL